MCREIVGRPRLEKSRRLGTELLEQVAELCSLNRVEEHIGPRSVATLAGRADCTARDPAMYTAQWWCDYRSPGQRARFAVNTMEGISQSNGPVTWAVMT